MPELNELLERYRRDGNVAAMDAIVARTRRRLLATARRIGDPQDAEDTVQATYYALLRRGDEPLDAPLIAWLLTVTVRIAYRRKAARRKEVVLAEQLSVASDEPGPAQSAAREERNRYLRARVAGLPPKYRDAIVLRYLEGLSGAECARLLDCSETALRTRLKRARDLLRSRLHPRLSHGLLLVPWWLADSARSSTSSLGVVMKTKVAFATILVALVGLLLVLADAKLSETEERADGTPRAERSASIGRDGGAAEGTSRGTPADPDAEPEADLPSPVEFEAVDRDRDVHGTVVDRDGNPVAGANLQLLDYPWRRTTLLNLEGRSEQEVGPEGRSARDGTFRIPWERARAGYLDVSAAGFAGRLVPLVQAGERMRIVLDAGATVVARAKDERGEPVRDAEIALFRPGGQDAVGARRHEGVTDAEGRCRLEGIHGPCRVYVSLRHRDHGMPDWKSVDVPGPGGLLEVEILCPRSRTIRGRVTDARTGEPVAGARIGLGWTQRLSVRSDESGHYVLPGCSRSESAEIHVSHDRFGCARAEVGTRETVDFQLAPGDRVVGRLVDAEGAPVAGAQVAALAMVRRNRERILSRAYASSREDGTFDVRGLRHDVGHALIVQRRRFGRLIYDFDPAGEAGGTIDLGTIVLPEGRCIEGRVTGEGGGAAARIEVTVEGENADRGRYGARPRGPFARLDATYGQSERRVTDDLGRFRFPDLAPGSSTLSATIDGGARSERTITIVDQDVRGVVLDFEGVRDLLVSVVDATGLPVGGAILGAVCDGKHVRLESKADGTARFRAKESFRHVRVQHVRPREGQSPVVLPAPYLQPGPDVREIRFELSAGDPITGVVLAPDGEPLFAANVIARDGENIVTSARTDEEGRFELAVAAGTRFDLVYRGSAMPTRGRTKLAGRLLDVAAGTRDCVLRLRPLQRRDLRVRVVDPDGRPLAQRPVHCEVPAPRGQTLLSDEEGWVVFQALPTEECRIWVRGSPRAGEEFMMPPPKRVVPNGQEVTLRCRTGTVLKGRVSVSQVVTVRVYRIEDGKRVRVAMAPTHPTGEFRIMIPDEEGKGPFLVEAGAMRGNERVSGRVEEVYVNGPELVIELRPEKE